MRKRKTGGGGGGGEERLSLKVHHVDTSHKSLERFYAYKLTCEATEEQSRGGVSDTAPTAAAAAAAATTTTTTTTTVETANVSKHMLTAYIMANGICVLTATSPWLEGNVVSVCFEKSLSTEAISGKKKKGARKIRPDTKLCTIVLVNQEGQLESRREVQLFSPVGGQVLELNTLLVESPLLVATQALGRGFVAVVFPDEELPSLENGGVVKSKDNFCFAFRRGSCVRGDACKFKHTME